MVRRRLAYPGEKVMVQGVSQKTRRGWEIEIASEPVFEKEPGK